MEKITINIIKCNNIIVGPFSAYNADPFIRVPILSSENYDKYNVDRGDEIEILKESGKKEKRKVFAINVESSIGLELICPQVVNNKKPSGYPSMKYLLDNPIELRPGTKIVGGRDSGFYDNHGVILKAEWTGGDIMKWEDWIFYVLSPSNFRQIVPQWIIYDQIGFGVSEPEYVKKFHQYNNDTLSKLLENGEKEILEYFHYNPLKVTELHPKQFELFISSIYKNNGFNVEQIGSWNQADGGVDILAISKIFDEEIKVAIQCKVSKNKISAKPIRELSGVLDAFKAHKGVVATNSTFTKDAYEEFETHFWKVTLEDINSINIKLAGIFNPEFKDYINRHKNNYK